MAWTDFLRPGAMLLAGGFDVWDRDQRREEMNRDAARRQAMEMAHFHATQQSRGGGGGGRRGNVSGATNALNENYGKALELLAPYRQQALETLPVISEAFNQGVQGFTPLANQVLNPEFTQNLTSPGTNLNFEMELPKFLKGGKK